MDNLHSNMVRFIMNAKSKYEAELKYIYIPIWLDLLLKWKPTDITKTKIFTFQYG